MSTRKRIEALESRLAPQFGNALDNPAHREWISGFFARLLRGGELSIEHVSAEDQAGWAERIIDWPLADFLERAARVLEEF